MIDHRNTTTVQASLSKCVDTDFIYISVQGKSIGNIQNYEALEGVY
jgi:hypothetical protein